MTTTRVQKRWRAAVIGAAVLVLTSIGLTTAPTTAQAAPTDVNYIRPTYVTTNPGTAPTLPASVTAVLQNGSTSSLSVSWAAVSSDDYGAPGDFTVTGTVSGTTTTVHPVAYVHVADYADLAAGQPVTVSSTDTGTSEYGTNYSGSLAVDGNRTSEWSRWNSLPNNSTASIEVNLQSVKTIDVVRLYWEIAYASAYTVQVAGANHVFTTVSTVNSGDGGIDTIAFAPTAAQYVRVTMTAYGSQYSLYSIQELEVYNVAGPAIAQITPEVVQAKANWANAGSKVMLFQTNADPTVYYTTDGSDPRSSSTRSTYSSAIALTASRTVLKVATASTGGTYSTVQTFVYNLYPNHDLSAVPEPVADAHANLLDLYNASWSTAVQWEKHGNTANNFADRWHDEGFNDHFFQVDSAYVSIMDDFSNDQFGSVDTLDNSYRKQSDISGASFGYIDREQLESNGHDYQAYNAADSINPPLFAWAEWLHYIDTGDASHFMRLINGTTVLGRLVNYYNWVAANRTLTSGPSAGLLYNAQLATSYDNTPASGQAWIDMSAEQASSALYISKIAALVGQSSLASTMQSNYTTLVNAINSKMWDSSRGFYFNKNSDGTFDSPLTGLALFTLMAGVPTSSQAGTILNSHLLNTAEFNTMMPLPNLAANDPSFNGQAFRGSITFNNTFQVLRGLDNYGDYAATHDFALRTAEAMSRVLQDPHTWAKDGSTQKSIWSSYSPTYPYFPASATDAQFVGWSGLGATTSLIEDVIGLQPNAPSDTLTWNLALAERNGIQNYKFGDNTVSLVAAARASSTATASIQVTTSSPFTLIVNNGSTQTTLAIPSGTSTVTAPGPGAGLYEAEQQSYSATAGSTATQDMQTFSGQWSAHAQIIWGATAVGQQLNVPFPIGTAQTGALTVGLTTAPDYGQVQVLLDGNPIGSPVDLYSSSVGRTVVNLGSVSLAAGSHTISLKVTGKNASSSHYYAGFDDFQLN